MQHETWATTCNGNMQRALPVETVLMETPSTQYSDTLHRVCNNAACSLQVATCKCSMQLAYATRSMQHAASLLLRRHAPIHWTGNGLKVGSRWYRVCTARRIGFSMLHAVWLYAAISNVARIYIYTYQGRGDEVCPPRFAESLVDALHRGNSGAIAIRSRMR